MANYKFYLDDTEIGLEKLLTVLGVDRKMIPKRNVKEFEINPDRVKKDKQGNPKFPKSTGVATKMTVWSEPEGRYVDVRIASNVRKVESKAGFRNSYYPSQIFFHGKNKSANNNEEYHWMFLNPDSEGSPFRKPNAKWRYRFIDGEANATNDLKLENQRHRAMSLIIGDNALTVTQLRVIAKGLGIAAVDDMGPDEVRVSLKRLAVTNPVDFYEKCKDRTVIFNGIIQEAIDKEILRVVSGDGIRRWVLDNEELAIIPSGSDSVKIVQDAVSLRAQELVPRIKDAIDGKSAQQIIKSPAFDGLFEDYENKDLDNLPPAPPAKEIINAAQEAAKLRVREEKLEEYVRLIDLPQEEQEKIHHAKKLFIQNNRDEILAYKAKLAAQAETV